MNIERRFQWAVTAATCLLLAVPYARGKTIYVDARATGANDGKNWVNAYVHLQDALADAGDSNEPGEIRVAQGVYRPDQGVQQMVGDIWASFMLLDRVTLMGGYAGAGGADPNTRDIEAFETILSGDLNGDDEPDAANDRDNSQIVVLALELGRSTVLDGFIITAGHGVGGGPGISCYHSDPIIRDCKITRNMARGWLTEGFGGGMYNIRSSPILTRCTFEDNTAEMQGGAMWNQSGSRPTLIQCRFIGNRSVDKGGAIRSVESDLTLTECIFEGNESYHGGAIDSGYQNHLNASACVFRGNVAATGGAVFTTQSQALLTNCLFSDNRAFRLSGSGNGVQSRGGAIYVEWSSNVAVVNCTCVANTAAEGNALACEASRSTNASEVSLSACILDPLSGQDIFSVGGSELTVQYTNGAGLWPGEGNIDIDPCFVDSGHWEDPCSTPDLVEDDIWVDGDYHLKSQAGRFDGVADLWVYDDVTSPCIDAGDPLSPIGHEPFRNGGIVNMGAYGGTTQASQSYFSTPVTPENIGRIIGWQWILQKMTIDGDEYDLRDTRPFIEFSGDGTVSGFASINHFFGSIKWDDQGEIQWSPLTSTKMAGPVELMAQERAFLEALPRLQHLSLDWTYLQAQSEDEQVTLVFSIPLR